ncbi:MAG TPA: NAD-dependent epimerase/dehydratase family protein [Terriglobia bacterium]|jgi:UDP-glucose 4-epimerase|nr:NAD-dependent epimerase/dehydratase family protein [Terriglobia bacterium]
MSAVMRNQKALVTGAAGFIGSHVVDELLRLGCAVVALDDLSGGFGDNVDKRARFIQGSVTDAPLIARLFTEQCFDYVFHLAAYAAEGLSHFIRRFNYENNLLGSVNLINAAVNHAVQCFVFTSSIAVYGRSQLPMTEDLIPQPEDPYGISKYATELDLRAAHELFGLRYIVFRPHNVYGERQNIGDKYRNVVGIFMNNILQNQPLPVFGDGEQTRAFSYVRDVAPIIARSVKVPGAYNEVFNIGAEQPYTVNELARAVCTAMGVEFRSQYLPARTEVKHAYSDHAKAAHVFGYSPQVSLEEGLRRMTDWVRQAGARQARDFGALEIARNLPPSWQKA